MSEACSSRGDGGVVRSASGSAAAFRAADWLYLAAAPVFAVMALVSAVQGQPDLLCSTTHDALPLSGMAVMYLLMSLFHVPPWLRLISGMAGAIDGRQ